MLKETNSTGLYKDTDSGAIINNNDTEFHMFDSQRRREKELREIQMNYAGLKDEVAELKNLVRQLVGTKE